jgi:DNA modification methylase
MTAYYQHGGITIYHGDCREILPKLGRFDLLLTDPPYGIFKRQDSGMRFGKETIYTRDKSASEWDMRPDDALLVMLRDFCPKYAIWGGNYFASALGDCKGPLVWNKQTGNISYADGEIAWSNVAGTLRIFNHQWCGAFKDSERGLRAVHPTQKPVALMRWVMSLTPSSQSVLDPFMGSGTTLRAAKDAGLVAVGIEREEKYCEIAAKRMAQEVMEFA